MTQYFHPWSESRVQVSVAASRNRLNVRTDPPTLFSHHSQTFSFFLAELQEVCEYLLQFVIQAVILKALIFNVSAFKWLNN